MPTLANLLGISLEGRVYFGQDLVYQPHNLLPERYYLPTGSFINDEVVFIPEEQFSDGRAYPLTGGGPVTLRPEWAEDFHRAMQLLRMSDAYVESLPDLDS
jgi:phosphoglycerol transferase MdoB-like AlkP superfamily enzyme